jgi:hypothetical protein
VEDRSRSQVPGFRKRQNNNLDLYRVPAKVPAFPWNLCAFVFNLEPETWNLRPATVS